MPAPPNRTMLQLIDDYYAAMTPEDQTVVYDKIKRRLFVIFHDASPDSRIRDLVGADVLDGGSP